MFEDFEISTALVIVFIFICVLFLMMLRLSFLTSLVKEGGAPRKKTHDVVKDLEKHPRSKSEALIISQLEEITGHKYPTVNPEWLTYDGKTLELDGYNADDKIALEFSGPLHTKWFPQQESYKKYYTRIMKDIAKKEQCEKHGVSLIVVDMSLPRHHWPWYLKSRLYDIGFLKEAPQHYINEQVAIPFRNKQLEEELQLKSDKKKKRSLGQGISSDKSGRSRK